jgi:hypothetical protein
LIFIGGSGKIVNVLCGTVAIFDAGTAAAYKNRKEESPYEFHKRYMGKHYGNIIQGAYTYINKHLVFRLHTY